MHSLIHTRTDAHAPILICCLPKFSASSATTTTPAVPSLLNFSVVKTKKKKSGGNAEFCASISQTAKVISALLWPHPHRDENRPVSFPPLKKEVLRKQGIASRNKEEKIEEAEEEEL